ncbi:MAG TPA: alpha/beta fold hydrolase [Solirubrobacteraceae bacterium]
MSEIAVTREGRGPELLLVHGGASPRVTWHALRPLAAHWTLVLVHRRAYPPSPPARHDFERDALDLAPLLQARPHVLAHSYGVLGALIAATRDAHNVRSLTLIEPPLPQLAPGDPDVEEMERAANAVLTLGLDADPAALRAFLALAGAPDVGEGELSAKLQHSIRRAHHARLPGEARPQLRTLRDAQTPALVASGAHSRALERICDALARELHGERLIVTGAGHFVQRTSRFAECLQRHLARAE